MAWFLKLTDIKGSSEHHPDYMEVEHWHQSCDIPYDPSAAGPATKSLSNAGLFNVTVAQDKSCVDLAKACLCATPLAEGLLEEWVDVGGSAQMTQKYTMKDVKIVRIDEGGSRNGTNPPGLTLYPTEFKREYKVFDKKGKAAGTGGYSWDYNKHKCS